MLGLIAGIVGFLGGALSATVAEAIRRRFYARRERKELLGALLQDTTGWLENPDDLMTADGLPQARINIPTLGPVIPSELFIGPEYDQLREYVLAVHRAANFYNAMFDPSGTQQHIRARAGAYARDTLIPRLDRVRDVLERHLLRLYEEERVWLPRVQNLLSWSG